MAGHGVLSCGLFVGFVLAHVVRVGVNIVFNGCGTIVADYGYLDDVGRVEESLGTVTLEESGYTYTAN